MAPIKSRSNKTLDKSQRKLRRTRIHEKSYRSLDEKQKKSIDKTREHILKIIANSTSYGIFIQINSSNEDDEKRQKVKVHGLESFETEVTREETPGTYFNPIMSVFLTAGSRLILAAAEKIAYDNSRNVAYFDTDSIFVSPETVEPIQDFFKSLNPYDVKDLEMFKVEDSKDGIPLHDKWFYGISAKRYVIYDYDEKTKQFTIYKQSLHGLGHLQGIDQEKWWKDILRAQYEPELKDKIVSEYEDDFAVSKVGITTYTIMNRFKGMNSRRTPYKDRIKPFNFATIGAGFRLDPDTKQPIIPFMPYAGPEGTSEVPFKNFVDYKTGKTYTGNVDEGELDTEHYWKPLSVAFEQYMDHPESKFEGSIGELKRKHLHISADSIRYIGKETNELDRAEVTGAFPEDETQYIDYCKILMKIKPARDWEKIGLSRRHIIELQKHCKNGKHDFKENVKEKLRNFQNNQN